MIKAIETSYKGYRFRSRLEARWAVYFDEMGLKWEYEWEGFDLGELGWYLPDFWLPQVRMWAEVKPGEFSQLEFARCKALHKLTGFACVMLDGVPKPINYYCTEPFYDSPDDYGLEQCTDVIINTDYLHENRFYACTGAGYPVREEWPEFDLESGVQAARSARFEHGESPC